MNMVSFLKRIYNPSVMALMGAALGLMWPGLGQGLKVVPTLYGQLLMTAITPYLATIVIGRVLHFRSIGNTGRYAVRFFLSFFLLVTILVMLTAVIVAWVPHRYTVSDADRREIGQLLSSTGQSDVEFSHRKLSLSQSLTPPKSQGQAGAGVIEAIIPPNIYRALERGDALAIIVFSILIGLAVRLPSKGSGQFEAFCVGIAAAAKVLMGWFSKFQPFAMFCLMVTMFAQMGSTIILASAGFIELLIECTLTFVLVCIGLVWYWSGKPLSAALACFREPLLVTAVSNSSISAIPAVALVLEQNLAIARSDSEAILPLGIALQNYGVVLYFLCALVFSAHLLWHPYSILDVLTKMVPATMAATGVALGGSTIGSLKIAGDMISLPTEVAIILLSMIDLLAGPCRQICVTCGNITMTAFVFTKK